MHHLFATLRTLLTQALRWNLIARNPCDSVTAPSIGHSEVAALDESGAVALLEGLKDTCLAVPVNVALLTGLRRGEILALSWSDVDLDGGFVKVRRSLEQLQGGDCDFKDTKRRKSRRTVPLTNDAIEILKAHRAAQHEVRLASGGSYNPSSMVFPEPGTGQPWGPDRFSSMFYYRVRKLGIDITFHGLRHSFATIALRARVPMKMVSEILGHTTTAITADLYTHVLDDMQREAVESVSHAIGRKRLA